MAEYSASVPLNRDADPEDLERLSPNSSARKACCTVLQSWISRKFMTGCVVLFPVAITFLITWSFIQFVDGFFSPLYANLGIHIFGVGFATSLVFVLLVGIFVSSWLGAGVFSIGEWFIKKMPLVRHIYSAFKQISTAISPGTDLAWGQLSPLGSAILLGSFLVLPADPRRPKSVRFREGLRVKI